MPRFQIQCRSCGTRLEMDLNEVEAGKLRAPTGLTRYCKQCAGNTQWKEYGAPSTVRLSRAEVMEQAEGSKKVLLIDDDDDILKVLGKVLSGLYFELDVASTGREAIQKLSRNDYDLILSDIRMPELDGKQLFAFLEENMAEYKERLIFLTGDTQNPATMEFLTHANCPYLSKPLEIPTLLKLLHQFFSAP